MAHGVAQRWKWVSGSWVTASDPLTPGHDDEIKLRSILQFFCS